MPQIRLTGLDPGPAPIEQLGYVGLLGCGVEPHLLELLLGDWAEVGSVDVLVEGFEVAGFEALPDGLYAEAVTLLGGVRAQAGCWRCGWVALGLGALGEGWRAFSLAVGSPFFFVFGLDVLGYFLFLLRIGTGALLLLPVPQKIPGTYDR